MKNYYSVGAFVIVLSFCFVVGEEFVKQPKEKKVYVSYQQCAELDGEIIESANSALSEFVRVQKAIIDAQKCSMIHVNNYFTSEKDCFLQKATKDQRADVYAEKVKIKQELEDIIDDLRVMNDRIEKHVTMLKAH